MKRRALFACIPLAFAAFFLATRQPGLAQEGRGDQSAQEALTGKDVRIFFREAFSPHEEFESIHSLDGRVVSVCDEGLLFESTRSYTTRFVRGDDGSRVAQFPDEGYRNTLFIPWAAIKYVKRA